MSRLGDFFSDTFAQAKSHEPDWIQNLPSMPGTPQSLQDAFIKNKWNDPFGDQNSFDIFAGGVGHPAGSENPWARGIGRTVGSIFGAGSLYGAGAGSSAGSGATEVGAGYPLAGEAGGAGASGQLSGPGMTAASSEASSGGGINWSKLFSPGGAGNMGIGAIGLLLNANKQRQDANRPLISPQDEQDIVQQGTNALARSLSATEGNPAGSGHAQQELQNYATKTLARLRYEQAIRQRAAQSQASNNMFGAGTFGLQALLRLLTQGGGGSSGTTTTIPPIGDAVY